VAVEPGVPCETCFLCMDGRYNLCEDVKFSGVYPDHGTIQRYKTHPAKWCHKLPPNVSYAEGALLEPLSVVMHGIKTAGLSLGRGAVICGAGPIGLIALAAARASGAHPLVITDLEPNRLAFAKKFVPTAITYQVDRNLDAESNAKKIRSLFDLDIGGEYAAPETVLECTGVENSVVTAAYTARRGGTVMVIGVGREIMNNLPFMHLSLAEVSLNLISLFSHSDSGTEGLTFRADRSEVHQPLSRHLAHRPPVSCWSNLGSQTTREPYIPTRESVGRAPYMWRFE
jgi:L-iditol 2-dehydrogenase